MTGVLRVAKAGYLSGLNNLEVYSLLDSRYSDKYGLLRHEVSAALEVEQLSDRASDVERFYDGYDTAISRFAFSPFRSFHALLTHKGWCTCPSVQSLVNDQLPLRSRIGPLLGPHWQYRQVHP
jgi:Predicted AAA-ATPase